jgi:hypothetical protein
LQKFRQNNFVWKKNILQSKIVLKKKKFPPKYVWHFFVGKLSPGPGDHFGTTPMSVSLKLVEEFMWQSYRQTYRQTTQLLVITLDITHQTCQLFELHVYITQLTELTQLNDPAHPAHLRTHPAQQSSPITCPNSLNLHNNMSKITHIAQLSPNIRPSSPSSPS